MDVDGALGIHEPRTGVATSDAIGKATVFVVVVFEMIELRLAVQAESDRLLVGTLLIHIGAMRLAHRSPGSISKLYGTPPERLLLRRLGHRANAPPLRSCIG